MWSCAPRVESAWTDAQRKMMRQAGRSVGARCGGGLAVSLLVAVTLLQAYWFLKHRDLEGAVESIANAPSHRVQDAIASLAEFSPDKILNELNSRFDEGGNDERLNFAFALAAYGYANEEFLIASAAKAPENQCGNIVKALSYSREEAIRELRRQFAKADLTSK